MFFLGTSNKTHRFANTCLLPSLALARETGSSSGTGIRRIARNITIPQTLLLERLIRQDILGRPTKKYLLDNLGTSGSRRL
jgi:hypothetical protein